MKICGVTDPADAALAAGLGAAFLGLNFWPGSPRFLDPARARAVAAAARAAAPGVQLVGVFVNPTPAEVEAATAAAGLDLVQLSGDEPPATVRGLAPRTIKALRLETPAAEWEALVAGYEDCWGWLFDAPRRAADGSPAVHGRSSRDDGAGRAADYGAVRRAADYGAVGRAADYGAVGRAAEYGGTGRAWDHGALAPLLAAAAYRRVFVAGGLTPANVRQVVAGLRPFAIDVCSGVESAPGRKDPRLLRQLFEEIEETGDGEVTSAT